MIRIVTYTSVNADPGKEWAAYLDNGSKDYLPVRFTGSTEEAATSKAQAEWDKHETEREANIASREEGRRKAAATRERKKEKAE